MTILIFAALPTVLVMGFPFVFPAFLSLCALASLAAARLWLERLSAERAARDAEDALR